MINIDIQQIKRLYFDEELTLTEVGARIGVCRDTIWKRLLAAGYKCRSRGSFRHSRPSKTKGTSMFDASDFAEIKRLYCKEKISANDIAFRYDCSSSSIRIYLKRQGVRMRTIQEAQTLRREKEVAKMVNQHQTSISRELEKMPVLSREEVTIDRIFKLRHKDNLTIDAIAKICELSNLEIYNILYRR